MVVSPDGRNVFAATQHDDAVVRFLRNTTTGAIVQPSNNGCYSESGSGGCSDGDGLDGAQAIAISPDGRSLYVGSGVSQAVARFDRRPTGFFTQFFDGTPCIGQSGAGPCADGHGLNNPYSVAVLPGGFHVYAATGSSVAHFNRVP